MMMTMRGQSSRVSIAGLVGILALGAVGCGDDNGTDPRATDMDRVTLGTVPIQSTAGDLPAPTAQPDAQMQLVLNQIAAANPQPLHTLSPAQARNQPTFADAVRAAVAAQGRPASAAVEPVARIAHRTIPGPDGTTLLVRVYTPSGTGPFPVVVYYHGGGWVITDLDDYDASARALTNAARAVVMSVAYRQAPTHKFPAAHEDAFAAYRFARDSAAAIGGNPTKVAVAGESAGGNLAAAVCLMARDRGVPLPVYQLLVYPITDFNFETPSYKENANAQPLNKPLMQWFFDKYLRSAADGSNPYVSPLRATSLAGLPPATVINAQIDPLRSEGEAYAAKLAAAGVTVDQTTYLGVTHEFFGMGAVVDKAKLAQAQAAAGLKRGFGG
jgi:acetyl esterase/lipase